MTRNRKGRRCFVLFEVLVASAVFAFAMVSLAMALTQTIEAAIVIQQHTAIRIALQARLAEFKAKPFLVTTKDWEEPDANGIAYQEEIVPLKITNRKEVQLPGLYAMTLRAKFKMDGQDQEEIAQIIVFR